MEKTNNISIGENKWIEWLEVHSTEESINIDDKLLKIKQFWTYLETECVAGCCGIDAFALWSEDIKNAKENLNDPELRKKLEELKNDIQEIQGNNIFSLFLNNVFHKKVFIQLINHLLKNVE